MRRKNGIIRYPDHYPAKTEYHRRSPASAAEKKVSFRETGIIEYFRASSAFLNILLTKRAESDGIEHHRVSFTGKGPKQPRTSIIRDSFIKTSQDRQKTE